MFIAKLNDSSYPIPPTTFFVVRSVLHSLTSTAVISDLLVEATGCKLKALVLEIDLAVLGIF